MAATVLIALLACGALPWMVASTASAQSDPGAAAAEPDPSQPPQSVEEITVIGSHIPRTNLDTGGPVNIIGADEIALSGVGTVDQLLRQLPSVGTQGINRNDNNGGRGLAFIELRNLEASRTLVLLNGRRLPVSSTGVVDAVDLNAIPTSLVERVEVLRDGASALYGSDAVAGVVNFVLKDRVNVE